MTIDRQWLNSLSREEWKEIYDDAIVSYQTEVITVKEFADILIKLGVNATEIADLIKEFQPL